MDKETQRDVVMEIAMRKWFETEEAADVVRCERLSAAIQGIKDLGVRVLSETRYFGSRKLNVYLVPPHTDAEMWAIYHRLEGRNLGRFAGLVKRLATRHPLYKAAIPPMPGTPAPTEKVRRSEPLYETISQLLESEWLTSREVRIRFKTSRLAAIVRKLRKAGVRVDDLWRCSGGGNPFKEYRIFVDDCERDVALGRRAADAKAEKASAERERALREVAKLKAKTERVPKRYQRVMGELLSARIELIALLLANAAEKKVELAQMVLRRRAVVAKRVGAIMTDPDMVVARCMQLTPGRRAECLDTEAGRALDEVDSQLDRQDVLRENYLRHQQNVKRLECQLTNATNDRGGRLDELDEAKIALLNAERLAMEAGAIYASPQQQLSLTLSRLHPCARPAAVVEYDGRRYQCMYEVVRGCKGTVVGNIARWTPIDPDMTSVDSGEDT